MKCPLWFRCVLPVFGLLFGSFAHAAVEGTFFGGGPAIDVSDAGGNVVLHRSENGDAFTLWGAETNRPADLPDTNDSLRVTFGGFSGAVGVQVLIKCLGPGGVGKAPIAKWIENQTTPGTVTLESVRALAANNNIQVAESILLQFRILGGAVGSSVTIENIEIGLPGTPIVAAQREPRKKKAPKVEEEKVLPNLEISTSVGPALQIFRVGTDKEAKLVLKNLGDEQAAGTLSAEIEDFAGNKTPIEAKTFDLAGGASQEIPLPLAEIGRGIFYVHTKLTSGDKSRKDLVRFGVMVPNGIAPGNPTEMWYGLCAGTDVAKGPAQEAVCRDLFQFLGIKTARMDLDWEHIQPDANTWKWDAFDRTLEVYKELNVEPQLLLAYSPPWAVPENLRGEKREVWRSHPPDLEAFARYAGTAAERYSWVKFWEVWNEPDLTQFYIGSVEEYLAMLKTAHSAIREKAPQAQILTGGFATARPHGLKRFPEMQERVAKEGADFFEIMAHHEHADFSGFLDALDRLTPIKKITGDKPWFFNETAYNPRAITPETERLQAVGLVKKHLALRAWGGKAHYWFSYIHAGGWGVVRDDNQPKAVTMAYGALIATLGQKPYLGRIDLGEGNFGYLLGDKKSSVAVVWSESPNAERGVVTVPLPKGASAKMVDIVGNVTPLEPVEGRIGLTVDSTPAYFVFEGLPSLKLETPLISIPGPLLGYRGDRVEVRANLHNPLDREATFSIGLVDDPKASEKVTLAKGATETVTLPFSMPKDDTLRYGDLVHMPLAYDVSGTGWKGTLTIPMLVGALIPSGSMDRPADFSVKWRPAIQGLFDYAPGQDEKVWKGPKDLSFEAWMALEGDQLVIRVDVTDDKHVQANDSATMWQSDSLEIGLAANDASSIRIGFARLDDGSLLKHAWGGPESLSTGIDGVDFSAEPRENGMIYTVKLPLALLGLTPADLQSGIKLNLQVNDDDGFGREGWGAVSPGIAPDFDSGKFPVVRFE